MNLENQPLNCTICLNKLKTPVLLPCGHSICKHHQENERQVTCKQCNETHKVPPKGFTQNKSLEYLIERDIESMAKGEEYISAMKMFSSFNEIYDELKRIKSDPKLAIHDEISAMKAKVDLRREELKLRIDQEAIGIIGELDECETICLDEIEPDDEQLDEKLIEWENELIRMRGQLAQFEPNVKKFKEIWKTSRDYWNDVYEKYQQYKEKLLQLNPSNFHLDLNLDLIK